MKRSQNQLAAIPFALGATCICRCLNAAGRIFAPRCHGSIRSVFLLVSIAVISQRRDFVMTICPDRMLLSRDIARPLRQVFVIEIGNNQGESKKIGDALADGHTGNSPVS